MSETLLSPVGRLVQGHCFESQKTDQNGRPLTYNSGPQAGQPREQWFIGLAVEKTNPEVDQFRARLHQIAQTGFPHLFDAAGACTHPQFAFKYVDGDGRDQSGKPFADRTGFAGCWVFRFSSGYPPRVFTAGGAHVITDPSAVKRGHYIRVSGSAKPNGDHQKPGLFLNVDLIEHVAFGEEIVSGPDAQQVFGSAPPQHLPAGASSTPPAPSTAPAPATTAPPAAAAPAAPAAPAAQPPAATPPVQPAPDFLNPPAGGAGAPPPPASAAAPPAGPQMTDKAGGYTREQMHAAGWTDAQLIEHGYMTA